MPTFHYKCGLLITYNPDNISKNNPTYWYSLPNVICLLLQMADVRRRLFWDDSKATGSRSTL